MAHADASGWLVLLDIDGTLVWRASKAHALAVVAAIHEVHGQLELQPVDAAGMTDRRIVRAMLRGAGMDDPAIDADMDWLLAIAARRYEELCEPDLSHTVLDGIPELLDELSGAPGVQLGLVTGNVESIAHRKLAAAGIAAPLLPFVGAYGSDAEDRDLLVPVAQERAGLLAGMLGRWPSERTVVVGDTPHDISCARAAGAAVIAVTTGAYGADALTAADAVASDAVELRLALARVGVLGAPIT
ncbi:MAG: haloacid dehalogenase-like hydrolase [Solirubrobacteraceae bacterium]|nr:haloacid dehalogenase-like hydrolase [Solirubrobacteraceae bacterium]